jgi:hypothetical protein
MPPSSTPMVPPPAATNVHTPIAFARSCGWEQRHDDRQRHSLHRRAADALDRAGHPSTACEPASPRAREAIVKIINPATSTRRRPKEIRRAASEQQEPAECQDVGVDDPRQRVLREAQVALDRRQGNVHDRLVQHDHERAGTHQSQGQPAPARVNERHYYSYCSIRAVFHLSASTSNERARNRPLKPPFGSAQREALAREASPLCDPPAAS